LQVPRISATGEEEAEEPSLRPAYEIKTLFQSEDEGVLGA
jgi:hypothetical protein